jgi:ATP-dependent RNA helicase DHX37/DHR1
MKAMGIDKVVNFPFPTPPDREQLAQSEKLLEYLGALDKDRHITRLGESMSSFPLLPRYSKMIILGQQFNNMPYIIAIVAGLSVGSPFLTIQEVLGRQQDAIEDEENGQEPVESENVRQIHKKFDESRRTFDALEPGCDVIRLLWAIGAYEAAGATDEFCEGFFLRAKQMKDIRKLRIQITNIVNDQLSGIVAPVKFSKDLIPPSKEQIRALKQTVTAAFLDHLAIRSSFLDPEVSHARSKNILRVGYTPLIFPTSQNSTSEKREVYIHPSSALAKLAVPPDYVVYSDIRESQDGSRLRLLPLTTVSAKEIEPLAKGTPLIQYSKPLNYPPPRFFSENGVMKKEIYVVPRFGIQGRGWELPSIKQVENVIQR